MAHTAVAARPAGPEPERDVGLLRLGLGQGAAQALERGVDRLALARGGLDPQRAVAVVEQQQDAALQADERLERRPVGLGAHEHGLAERGRGRGVDLAGEAVVAHVHQPARGQLVEETSAREVLPVLEGR